MAHEALAARVAEEIAVRCPACGTENAPERRFCGACGTALPRACPNCGFANDGTARFCGGCGRPLALPPAPAGEAPPPLELAEGERRQVTVLFADLSGYTRLSRELGAEAMHDLLERYFQIADQAVADHGGSVDKHIGDAVMALFGAPRAHGNDPERALRAALAIHEGIGALSRALGRPLAVHIGVASGEVVASGTGSDLHRAYTVTGDSVNLAARLTDRAEAGETLISEAVQRALADRIRAEPLGTLEVEGLDAPVPAFRVLGLATDASARPIVGRRAEIEQFQAVLRTCRTAGNGLTIHVRGEAGIGKSRLVEEFRRIAQGHGLAAHVGLVLDFGAGTGRDAIRALVRSLLGVEGGSDEDARREAAARAIASGLVDEAAAVHLNDLLDLPQPTELRSLYDAMEPARRAAGRRETVAALGQNASRRRPLLLVVEDIHWAEAGTLAHLATLAATVAACPALLVMTSRIEGDPLDPAWRASTGGSPLLTIDLGPLRRDEAMTLARDVLAASQDLAAACVERAEGNPLFLEHLVREAEEAGSGVPGTIQSLVLARIDRLQPADKLALQAASVIGQRFSLDAVRHLAGRDDLGCEALIRHHMVRPDGHDFLFAHALIRSGVYGSLLGATRRRLHGRAAEWFRGRDLSLAAEHLERAEDPAAAMAFHDAARAQAKAYRYERALELAERGLALARERGERAALTALKGELLHDLGAIEESIAAYRQALAEAEDDGARCRAWLGLAAGMRVTDRYDEAFAALEQAEALAVAQSLVPEQARAHWLRGNLCFPLGRLDDCRAEHERALVRAREAGSPDLEARALSGLGDASYARARMITAHDHFRRCVDLARAHGLGRIEVANLGMLVHTALYFRPQGEAIAAGLEAAEAAARVGHHRAELNACLSVFFGLYELDDREGVRAQVRRCQELVRRLGAWRFEQPCLLYLGRLALAEGDRGEARRLLEEAWRVAKDTGPGFHGPNILGMLALGAEDDEVRRSHLAEAEALLRAGTVGHNQLRFLPDAIDSALEAGDWAEALRFADLLEAFTAEEPLPWASFFIRRGRALARFEAGGRDDALTAELNALRAEAERLDLVRAGAALEKALV